MTKKHADYAAEIITLHNTPCLTATQEKRLHDCIKLWSERVPLEFMRPNNEQKPYTEKELGCTVSAMPRKAESGIKQVGDYIYRLPDHDCATGVLWERKGRSYDNDGVCIGCDMYGTMVTGRDRFIRECREAIHKQDYDILIIGAECTHQEFLQYRPGGASPKSRYAKWKHLEARFGYRVRVDWLVSREWACSSLVYENRLWLQYNYVEVLGL